MSPHTATPRGQGIRESWSALGVPGGLAHRQLIPLDTLMGEHGHQREQAQQDGRDPHMAILLLDFVLGYNASMDPVGELLDAISEAKQIAKKRGGALTVVASVCGTEGDPQDLNVQAGLLKEAGVFVFHSNARAAAFCCALLKK